MGFKLSRLHFELTRSNTLKMLCRPSIWAAFCVFALAWPAQANNRETIQNRMAELKAEFAAGEQMEKKLEAQLEDRGVTFELTEDATAWLADAGYDELMGARPLGRVIQENIKRPLAEEILFGSLQKGGTVKVATKKDGNSKSVLDLKVMETRPVKPKREPTPSRAKKKPTAKGKSAGKKPGGGAGSVPKVPLPAK